MNCQELAKKTGVELQMIRYYYDAQLLGSKRLSTVEEDCCAEFDVNDFERLQLVLMLRDLGFPTHDIRKIVSAPGFDERAAVNETIDKLIIKADRLKDIALVVRTAHAIGVTLFEFGAYSDESVSAMADTIRSLPRYHEKVYRIEGAQTEWVEYFKCIRGRIEVFAKLGKEEVEETMPKIRAAVGGFLDTSKPALVGTNAQALIFFLLTYRCSREISRAVDKIGGEGTAEFMSTAFSLVYVETAAPVLVPAMVEYHNADKTDKPARLDRLREIVDKYVFCDKQAALARSGRITFSDHEYLIDFALGLICEILSDEHSSYVLSLKGIAHPKREVFLKSAHALKQTA